MAPGSRVQFPLYSKGFNAELRYGLVPRQASAARYILRSGSNIPQGSGGIWAKVLDQLERMSLFS